MKVTWAIAASGGARYVSTISTNGLFRVNANEFNQLLQVVVYSTYDNSKRASTSIIVEWPPADKSVLIALITEAEGKVNDTQYTAASRAALQTVLTNAITLRDSNPPQALVNSTASVLRNAINMLDLDGGDERTLLSDLIAEAELKVNDSQYTQASRNRLQTAITNAKRAHDDDSTSAAELGDEFLRLSSALESLEKADTKEYFKLWGKPTTREKTPLNWFLLIICFGWIWMAF